MPYTAANDPNVFAYNEAAVGLRERESKAWFKSKTIVASDTVDLTAYADGLIVLVGGNLKMLPAQNLDTDTLTFTGVVAGQVLPLQTRRVFATGTTATVASLDVA